MSPKNYDVEDELAIFFDQTSATREQCEDGARQLTKSSKVVPVPIQGCRLKSLALDVNLHELVSEVYGALTRKISKEGTVGNEIETEGKEPLVVYLMPRMPGITYLDFILEHDLPQDEWGVLRQNFMRDAAQFFVMSWQSHQTVTEEYAASLRNRYIADLKLLYKSIPHRFQTVIQKCRDAIDDIFALPMVLIHNDFGVCNVLVDPKSCHITGMVDWAEATIGPFGVNMHSVELYMGHMLLRNGWSAFPNHHELEDTLWSGIAETMGGLSDEVLRTIKMARVVGCLRSHGFTCRLANEPPAVPIGDDDHGRGQMAYLDAFLLNPDTRFSGLG